MEDKTATTCLVGLSALEHMAQALLYGAGVARVVIGIPGKIGICIPL